MHMQSAAADMQEVWQYEMKVFSFLLCLLFDTMLMGLSQCWKILMKAPR